MAVGVDLVHVGNSFTIRDFKAAVTNQGNGDVAMACLTEQADKSKVRLDLRAFPDHELDENGQLKAILPEQKLIKFYESHGFFIIPGRHDYAPKMFRPPQRGSF
ncbi:MAG: hypothetical protein R3D88_03290 [Alphaproteobacteria bacterium]|nr:hypothetical protein [Alphaproteobacteria bacterium]